MHRLKLNCRTEVQTSPCEPQSIRHHVSITFSHVPTLVQCSSRCVLLLFVRALVISTIVTHAKCLSAMAPWAMAHVRRHQLTYLCTPCRFRGNISRVALHAAPESPPLVAAATASVGALPPSAANSSIRLNASLFKLSGVWACEGLLPRTSWPRAP